jgi:hypothetical protein
VLAVLPWTDPVIDRMGYDPRACYAERFWLGVLGPTALWLLRSLAARFDEAPAGFDMELTELSALLGLGRGTGKSSPLGRTIARCQRFGLVRTVDHQVIEARRRLPSLTRRRVERLPRSAQIDHAEWLRRELEPDLADPEATRRLARAMLDVGQDPDVARQRLARWGLPAGDDAVDWALASRQPTDAHGPATDGVVDRSGKNVEPDPCSDRRGVL